jgi:hypothetical protein
VPAPVAGRWQGTIPSGAGTAALEVDFEQKFQVLTGQATAVAGRSTRLRAPTIRGDALAFLLEVGSTQSPVRYSFRGRVAGDAVRGTVVVSDPARGQREHPWSAQRVTPASARAG